MIKHTLSAVSLLIITSTVQAKPIDWFDHAIDQAQQMGTTIAQHVPTAGQMGTVAHGVAASLEELEGEASSLLQRELTALDAKMVFNAVVVLACYEGGKAVVNSFLKLRATDPLHGGMDEALKKKADDAINGTPTATNLVTQGDLEQKDKSIKDHIKLMVDGLTKRIETIEEKDKTQDQTQKDFESSLKAMSERQNETDKKIEDLDTKVTKSLKELADKDAQRAQGFAQFAADIKKVQDADADRAKELAAVMFILEGDDNNPGIMRNTQQYEAAMNKKIEDLETTVTKSLKGLVDEDTKRAQGFAQFAADIKTVQAAEAAHKKDLAAVMLILNGDDKQPGLAANLQHYGKQKTSIGFLGKRKPNSTQDNSSTAVNTSSSSSSNLALITSNNNNTNTTTSTTPITTTTVPTEDKQQ